MQKKIKELGVCVFVYWFVCVCVDYGVYILCMFVCVLIGMGLHMHINFNTTAYFLLYIPFHRRISFHKTKICSIKLASLVILHNIFQS